MPSFPLSWAISALVLLLVAVWAGRQARFQGLGKPTNLGMLIDGRERFSLNHLQLVMWTLLILSTFVAILLTNLSSDPGKALAIPNELLGLLGISAGSATVAGAVKDNKDTTRPQMIAGGPGFLARPQVKAAMPPGTDVTPQPPSFVQVFLEEEGAQGQEGIVSVTKFQNFLFTLVLGVVYVVLTVKAQGYPVLDKQVLWLVGISHAGYVGGKMPDKA